jgi:lipopolysaccharide export system permease protein
MFLADDRLPDQRTVYTAKKALFARTDSGPKLLMFDGAAQTMETATKRLTLTRFADFTYDFAGLMADTRPKRRTIDELSTLDLLAADPALVKETGATATEFRFDGHSRFAQPLLAVGSALIGFAALMIGAFSRFGLWRQIALAVVLLIVVQGVATAATDLGLQSPQGWLWAYAAPLVAFLAGFALLGLAARPKRRPRSAEVPA